MANFVQRLDLFLVFLPTAGSWKRLCEDMTVCECIIHSDIVFVFSEEFLFQCSYYSNSMEEHVDQPSLQNRVCGKSTMDMRMDLSKMYSNI